ncbi:hypothetical protein BH09VER1_BH09VER1_08380 [soil metagenome]
MLMNDTVLCVGAGFVYALSSLGFKRAMHGQASAAKVTAVSNVAMAAIFQMLWLWPGAPPDWNKLYLPAISGALYFVAQRLAFSALSRGDVSLSTPLLGLKVIFVPLFSGLIYAATITSSLWFTAGLCFLGLFLLGRGRPRHLSPKARYEAILFSVTAAAIFALNDVVGQHWARAFGMEPYLALMTATMAALSLGYFIPRWMGKPQAPPADRASNAANAQTRCWLSVSSILLGLQGVVFALVLVHGYNNAAILNIAYSSRSVWSVLLITALAGAMKLPEGQLHRGEILQRLIGSVLIFISILLIL